jgi:flagellar assembly factor FliW
MNSKSMNSKSVTTKTLGTVTVTAQQCFTFPEGLLGFEGRTEFALIDAEAAPFFWLQSTEEAELAFLVVDPFLVREDYEADIDDEALNTVALTDPSAVLVLTIVTLPADGAAPTVNLQGPLIFNKANHRAFQAILADPRWPVKHPLGATKPGAPPKGGA